MVMRLDVGWRIYDGVNDTVTIDYNGAGPASVDLTPGLYLSLAELCAQLQTDWQAVHASFSVTESDGVVTIAATHNFDLDWDTVGLRDHLGFVANLAFANSYTASSASPGVFLPTQPWGDDALGWIWSTKQYKGPKSSGRVLGLGNVDKWEIVAMVRRSESDQFRGVIKALLRGLPGTWYRNTSDSTAWSYSNADGRVRVTLDPSVRDYVDRWADPVLLSQLTIPLMFHVWE